MAEGTRAKRTRTTRINRERAGTLSQRPSGFLGILRASWGSFGIPANLEESSGIPESPSASIGLARDP
eukprot:2332277-Pyramimonas_sp.AAC.1